MALVLVVVEGPDAGRSFEVTGDAVVGRDPTAAVQLTDQEVSRRHAIVSAEGDGVRVEDLGSSNGTWIGTDRVTGTAQLQVGATLQLGSTLLELREGEGSGDQPAAPRDAADPPATKVPLPDWRESAPPENAR